MTKFVLWLAAGNNVLTGDPLSHHLFMRCLFHANCDPDVKFDVKTVNINKKSDDFKQTGLRNVPGISTDDDEIFETEDDILDFLESLKPKRPNVEDAENATCDLLIKFARYLKNVDQNETGLNTELLRLDKFLQTQGTKFLCSDQVSQIDCLVLTRLHTIRISAKGLKNYDIPQDLINVKNYMQSGYGEEIFRLSCPSDQEIIIHWAELKNTPNLTDKDRARLVREKPIYTMTI